MRLLFALVFWAFSFVVEDGYVDGIQIKPINMTGNFIRRDHYAKIQFGIFFITVTWRV